MKRGGEKKKKRIKKGLSTIVVTLIIILVSLVAVGIIWVVVRNVIQRGSEGVSIGQFTLKAEIMNVKLDNVSNDVSLTVRRKPGEGQFRTLKFVFSDGKNGEVITETASINELEEKKFNLHLYNLSVSNLTSISIVPVFVQNGKETIGGVLDEYKVSQADIFQGSVLRINFVLPTPADGSVQSSNSVYINVSTYDANEHSAFIDWNRSLVGWWNFNSYNSSGIYDSSTYNNFGTFKGNLSVSRIVNAKRGNGLEMGGDGDYLQIANEANFDFTNNFTLEAWIKPRGSDTYSAIITKYSGSADGWDWFLQDGRIRMTARGTGTIDTGGQWNDLRDGNWHHIVVVITNPGIQQYIDGAPITFVSGNWTSVTNNVLPSIGYRSGLTNFNGTMDEIRIYSRALSIGEVRASYNAGVYRLYRNFTNLALGSYTYRASVIDSLGNIETTEQRSVTIL